MTKDHYISQVYLRGWHSPELGDRLHAIRKSDMMQFCASTASVCYRRDGSTNPYLDKPRVIEDVLKLVEPGFNRSLEKLQSGDPNSDARYLLSLFIAYVKSCSPAGMRLMSAPARTILEETAGMIDAAGLLPRSPETFQGKPVADLIRNGDIHFDVDRKYPQAIGIESIHKIAMEICNCRWEVVHNTNRDSPYLTSDLPIGVEPTDDFRVVNSIVPLSPSVAVRIHSPCLEGNRTGTHLRAARCNNRTAGRREVRLINQMIVRGAEELVFSRDNHDWVVPFVQKHARYRTEMQTHRIAVADGTVIVNRMTVDRPDRRPSDS